MSNDMRKLISLMEGVMAVPGLNATVEEDDVMETMTEYDEHFIGSAIQDMYPTASSREELMSMVAGQTGYGGNPDFERVFDAQLEKILGREDTDFPADDMDAPDIDDDSEFGGMDDMAADADALASAGHGSDEDYGYADEVYEGGTDIDPMELSSIAKMPIEAARARAYDILAASTTGARKKSYLSAMLAKARTPVDISAVLYNMVLKGEGNGVIGSGYSKKFGEDLQNGFNDTEMASGEDFFPTGADGPVVTNVGPSGARHGDNPEQKKMQVAEVHKELVFGYRNYLQETTKSKKKS